jgi:hypothetical protein
MEIQQNNQPEHVTSTPLVTPQPKKWYQHKSLIAVAILTALTTLVSWVALSKKQNIC